MKFILCMWLELLETKDWFSLFACVASRKVWFPVENNDNSDNIDECKYGNGDNKGVNSNNDDN